MEARVQTTVSQIHPVDESLKPTLQHIVDHKTKPVGALGVLESLAVRLGCIQSTTTPALVAPTIVVFAADHGLVKEGVSPYPQDVTYQMVYNFLSGGAAINVLSRMHGIDVMVVDVGVNHDFDPTLPMVHAKVAHGTENMLREPAMTPTQRDQAMIVGMNVVASLNDKGCSVVGFGEMGIGNTSSSSLLMSLLCDVPIERCVGRGTGLDDAGVSRKVDVLTNVLAHHTKRWDSTPDPLTILADLGGFELAAMVGGMLEAGRQKMAIVVDGFISTAAFVVASRVAPSLNDYAFFAHQSDEFGHRVMLDFLDAQPLLSLDMRLGEGSGVAVAYPILKAATVFLKEMASFESAGVSEKQDAP